MSSKNQTSELKDLDYNWGTIERMAKDRTVGRNFTAALNADRRKGGKRVCKKTDIPLSFCCEWRSAPPHRPHSPENKRQKTCRVLLFLNVM